MFRVRVFILTRGSWIERIPQREFLYKPRAATEGRPYSTLPGFLEEVEEGGDAGAEEETVEEAPEEHAGATADGVVEQRAEKVAGGVCDEEKQRQFWN